LEWERVEVGPKGFSRREADDLLASAREHPLGGTDGTAILVDHHRWLRSQQMVGIVAGDGCSLEILPKIDQLTDSEPLEARSQSRQRLVQMLDVALGLEIGVGREAPMARQEETLLDVLIRAFADRLANEVRRGLPRQYVQCEDDLSTLRGRLDATRQFTLLAVRADRLACRFDVLSYDTALLQVMKACIVALARHARRTETVRRLAELRVVLADVSDVSPRYLSWNTIRFDRTNRRWRSLVMLAKLFLRREWQSTHSSDDPDHSAGLTLLFPMNDLFEAYVAALLRNALAPLGFDVIVQGGLRHCLQERTDDTPGRLLFQTKPDIMVRKNGQILLVMDTKWKRLTPAHRDPKRGVSQSDIYQMMAYARLYRCPRLMLLYPFHAALGQTGKLARYSLNIQDVYEHLAVASLDLASDSVRTRAALRDLVLPELAIAT
jgi:5-methylcytosine-specific restriction enzyme subunit McrC